MVEPNSGSRTGELPKENSATIPSTLTNYHNREAAKSSINFSKRKNFRDNIDSLKLILQPEQESRNPTTYKQMILARYVGFDGLKEIGLDPEKENNWGTKADADLKPLVAEVYDVNKKLDMDESQGLLLAAKRSANNAHYTSFPIINGVWKALELAGFKGGEILEPSAGIGNFLAAMPPEIANKSSVNAIEMDRTTGKILQRLFPTAESHITGFEKFKLPENKFDLIITNIPFGDVKLYDPQLTKHRDKAYSKAANNLHNFFSQNTLWWLNPEP